MRGNMKRFVKTMLVTGLVANSVYAMNDGSLKSFLYDSKLKTDSILIYSKGDLLLEKYTRGYAKDKKHIMWSVSKSFTSAVAGLAVKDGALKLDQSICDFYSHLKDSNKCKITLRHLLNYTAGFDWQESYEPQKISGLLKIKKSDVLQMNNGVGNKDTAGYVLSRKLKYTPGEAMQYNTGTPNVVMDIVKKVYGDNYDQFVNEKLFKKLGIENYHWAKDGSGTMMGGSHLYTTPQTMLAFGKMYLNNGAVDGEQVLDESWIDFTRTQAPAKKVIDHQDLPGVDIVESMGGMWWLNTKLDGKTPWPDAPSDTYIAWGHWSQFIVVIPSMNAVIVRTGTDKKEHFDINKFIKYSIEYIKGSSDE